MKSAKLLEFVLVPVKQLIKAIVCFLDDPLLPHPMRTSCMELCYCSARTGLHKNNAELWVLSAAKINERTRPEFAGWLAAG